MDTWRKLTTLLNKPFPENESRFGKPKTALIVSLFITFFLIIFEPFGIASLGSDRYLICVGFGAMTFFTSIIYEFTVGQLLNLKGKGRKWTYGKWIIHNLGLMLFISLANFLFARLAIFGYIIWELLPDMIYGTFMVGIIPTLGLGAFALFRSERKHLDIASEMNSRTPALSSEERIKDAKAEGSIFDIPLTDIRYVEALQNYVKIGHITNSGECSSKSERATLKQILEQTHGSSIVKSHRSFLVNRDAIVSTEGNAQGLLLTLADCPTTIPVSRSFIPEFRTKQKT